MKKIVIAGGTGFLGQLLSKHYATQGYNVVVLSRSVINEDKGKGGNDENISFVKWDGETLDEWKNELDGASALINFCGKSVDCRYNASNMRLIYDTRLNSTEILGKAIESCENPPEVWINSSSATIYSHSEDRDMDEATGEIGTGFSVDVCQKWEKTFFVSTTSGTRKLALRIAIVLGRDAGAFQPLKNLARIGFGGKQGSGNQFFSWIHQDDFVNIVDYVINNRALSGVFNVSAPTPIKNMYFMRVLRRALKRPFGLPLPKWMLEIGAVLIQTETELILKSRRVVPDRLVKSGYRFEYPEVEDAVMDLVSN